ncbi:Peptidase family M50 [compost metagenome]|uniref:Site-2 protease family protein n=1 Tax=Paenibacillus rhizolycopersici TaxID=2780073 RepID=A0ABS2H2B7_9BACL|nr:MULTISPECIES: site-2 protease family protein [Paenibacillus]MBM6994923.1 site-2 protease family protein [Paenibacillus rhizolycopersici]MUG85861.1 site-2 protease family protein [Paenibacillus timonensis]GIP48239.1 zinc metalloprotease [Paenibacillus sp. J53TS2]
MEWLDRILRFPLDQLPFYLITLVIAFTLHEFSHAYFANKFGDPTAKLLGRVTLNPAVHFDLLGIILLLIAGFGWARPVPVNRDNFSKPRIMGVIVSVAGPLSNLLLGVLGTLVYVMLAQFGVLDSITNEKLFQAVLIFFNLFTVMNFFLFLFNLIPLPPLDGYRILEDVVPRRMLGKLQQYEQWSVLIFLVILIVPGMQRYTISPLYNAAEAIYFQFAHLFLAMFGA